MIPGRAVILGQLSALAEPTRSRLMLILEQRELTVSELCGVLQMPQSTVSRHLKALAESNLITSRAEGTRHLYSLIDEGHDLPSGRLWSLVREQIGTSITTTQDRHRIAGVLAKRQQQSKAFFRSSASQWDRLREELFGQNFHLPALLGLLDDRWVIGDLGSGSGHITAALAPFVKNVIAVDGSSAMLEAARNRLKETPNVELRLGELESLPINNNQLDAAILVLVLHHLPEPEKAISEVARVIRPGGRLVIVDMLPHDRDYYRQQMGHIWLGFSEDQLNHYLESTEFEGIRIGPLTPDPRGKGPALFSASARKSFN